MIASPRAALRLICCCADLASVLIYKLCCCLQKLFALARVFGNIPDDLFSRAYESMIFRTVARAGMGPKLLVRDWMNLQSAKR